MSLAIIAGLLKPFILLFLGVLGIIGFLVIIGFIVWLGSYGSYIA